MSAGSRNSPFSVCVCVCVHSFVLSMVVDRRSPSRLLWSRLKLEGDGGEPERPGRGGPDDLTGSPRGVSSVSFGRKQKFVLDTSFFRCCSETEYPLRALLRWKHGLAATGSLHSHSRGCCPYCGRFKARTTTTTTHLRERRRRDGHRIANPAVFSFGIAPSRRFSVLRPSYKLSTSPPTTGWVGRYLSMTPPFLTLSLTV